MLSSGPVRRSTLSLRKPQTVQVLCGWPAVAWTPSSRPLTHHNAALPTSPDSTGAPIRTGSSDAAAAGPSLLPSADTSAAGTLSAAVAEAMASGSMPGSGMLTDSDWDKLGQHLAAYDELREGVIKRCRDFQKLAKQAVYSLHRGDIQGADTQLGRAEGIAAEMSATLAKYPALRSGSFAAAVEEYVEARAFQIFLTEGRLVRSDELPLAEPEEFLGGVLDFTGELNRYAIARATVRDKAAVQRCRDLVEALMGRFLQFDLRNGALRKKYDSLKYTLKKMESTLYELALTEGLGLKVSSDAAAMEPEMAAAEGGADEARGA